MTTLAERAQVLQNMGLIDRVIRLFLGTMILGWTYYFSIQPGMNDDWATYSYGIALYPVFTGMLGWDPFYALFGGRSCRSSGRHPCGSLPYQVKALFGHAPRYCDTDAERSLEACHDDPADHPHHKVWRVDIDPVLYPDDKAWHRYFTQRSRNRKR